MQEEASSLVTDKDVMSYNNIFKALFHLQIAAMLVFVFQSGVVAMGPEWCKMCQSVNSSSASGVTENLERAPALRNAFDGLLAWVRWVTTEMTHSL